MAGQPGKNVTIAYKVESTIGTAVSGSGATVMRAAPGAGLKLDRTVNSPTEFRSDGQLPMGRLGHKNVSGSYQVDLSVGQFNAFFAAVLRSAFDGAQTISTATITTITMSSNQIVSTGSGSWLTSGLKVGDVFRITGGSGLGVNASVNLGPITAMTTSTLVVATGQLTTITTLATLTITRQTKVYNPSSVASMTRYSYTIEEYHDTLDDSEIFVGCRVAGVKLNFPADGVCTAEFRFVGMDETVPGTASAPSFTSPTLGTAIALQAADATIRFASGAITTLTSAEIDIDLGAAGLPVIGSLTSPDIFENACRVTVKLSGLRNDMANVSAFLNETECDLHIKLVEPESEPKDYLAFYIPRLKRLSADAPVGADGAMTETMDLMAAALAATTGYDTTTISIQSSI